MARLTLPLDATVIEARDRKQPVRALLTAGGKPVASQLLEFDPQGMAYARFELTETAGALRIVVGPPDASEDELVGLQTLGIDVPLRRFVGREGVSDARQSVRQRPLALVTTSRACCRVLLAGGHHRPP